MDVRARNVLSTIRSAKGLGDSIIFGGAARDTMLNVVPDSYNIAIPADYWSFCIDTLDKARMFNKGKLSKKNFYIPSVTKQATFSYENLDFALSGFIFKKDFADNVMETLDYGICRVYSEGGDQIHETKEFTHDNAARTLTLLRLDSIFNLPHAMRRYEYLSKRLGEDWEFRCPLLELKKIIKDDVPKYNAKLKTEPVELPQAPQRALRNDFGAWTPNLSTSRGRRNPTTFAEEAAEVPTPPVEQLATTAAQINFSMTQRAEVLRQLQQVQEELRNPGDLGDTW